MIIKLFKITIKTNLKHVFPRTFANIKLFYNVVIEI